MPSRLKGMETLKAVRSYLPRHSSSLTVPSRLKGMETPLGAPIPCRLFALSLTVPSRLKGMETQVFRRCRQKAGQVRSACAFPFEGNGNNDVHTHRIPGIQIRMSACAFPFEGNGNWHVFLELIGTMEVCLCLPV